MTHWKALQVERRDRSDPRISIWRLSGTLTSGKEGYAFLDDLRAQLRDRPGAILINLEGVEHVTSAGVGILAAAYTSAANAKTRLMLAAIPRQALTVLSILNLLSIIEHDETEEGGLARLSS
jgi:anti-anti-sigma factor